MKEEHYITLEEGDCYAKFDNSKLKKPIKNSELVGKVVMMNKPDYLNLKEGDYDSLSFFTIWVSKEDGIGFGKRIPSIGRTISMDFLKRFEWKEYREVETEKP